MSRPLRSAFIALAALVAGTIAPWSARSQATYPSQTIKLIIPASAGGLPDTVARIVGRRLQERLGQSVVVENRPGGNASVAVAALTGSPADGYTFMVQDRLGRFDQPADLRQARLRAPGYPAGCVDCTCPVVSRRAPESAGGQHAGVHRLCKSAARTAQLRLLRRRQHASSVHGGDQGRAQAGDDPHPVQGNGRIGARAAWRSRRCEHFRPIRR